MLVSQRHRLVIEARMHKESQVYSRVCRALVAKEGPRGPSRYAERVQ